jgi:hypothetical protein
MKTPRAIKARGFDEWMEIQASLPQKFKLGQPRATAKPKRKERELPIHSFAELSASLRNGLRALARP